MPLITMSDSCAAESALDGEASQREPDPHTISGNQTVGHVKTTTTIEEVNRIPDLSAA